MLRHITFILFLGHFLFAAALPPNLTKFLLDGRIVGGKETTIEEHPWSVSLQLLGLHTCGGSVIGPDVVLTAAHCVESILSIFYDVVYGATDLLQGAIHVGISRRIIHEDYQGLSNDVALVILSQPLTFNEKVQPIRLADEEPTDGDSVSVSGWGLLQESDSLTPNILHSVEVTIVDRKQCADAYLEFDDASVDHTMICAGVPQGGKDACSGDSGSSLAKDGVQVGIVSWGLGCARQGYPGVYTNVAHVRDWIRQNSGV